ncbi:hypothetical protein ACFY2J_17145 [Streptomyces collinus]|uniref:hypothetical protein n=1 Tax=Streptomyces collinus TaxID=42684 RepID=UPI0036C523FE
MITIGGGSCREPIAAKRNGMVETTTFESQRTGVSAIQADYYPKRRHPPIPPDVGLMRAIPEYCEWRNLHRLSCLDTAEIRDTKNHSGCSLECGVLLYK